MESSARSVEAGVLLVADKAAWRIWLVENEATSGGVWLLLAKKGTTSPTSLMYAEALDEALCSGWIDGQKKAHDASTFRQRFTPRRPRSMWSKLNVGHVARLIEEGSMRPRGQDEIDRAKADGRWDRAYAGAATAEAPADFIAALRAMPAAQERFGALSGAERYSVLHKLMTAPNQATRARRMERLLTKLTEGE